MKLLNDKNALITGGGRGIGKAVAIDFAKNGANVAVSSRTQSELDQTVRDIKSYGVKGLSIPADLSTLEGVSTCATNYFNNFDTCDILICNAGMTAFSEVIEYPIEKAQKLFNLNILGTYALIKEILPNMIENKGGKIIFNSSVQGNVYFGSKKVAYATSKAALTAMGKALQSEIAQYNIYVGIILPGAIETKLQEDLISWGQHSGKMDPPEAISPIFLFLASDLSPRKYKGNPINQQMLFGLLPNITAEVAEGSNDINDILKIVKDKVKKEQYSYLRKNKELIDFLLKYDK